MERRVRDLALFNLAIDCWLGQRGLVGEELQAPGLVGGGQPFQEQAAEEA